MVFLDVLVNYGCRRWLHKEDYSFDEGGERASSAASSKPAQYPLLGFKDRKLEDEYLEHLVVASKWRIVLGYVTATLLYATCPFAGAWTSVDFFTWIQQSYLALSAEEKEDFKESAPEGRLYKYFPSSLVVLYACHCLMLLVFILGLVAVVLLYQMERFERRRTWIFFITPAIYLVYMAGAGIVFAFANQAWKSYFGPASWVFLLMIGAVSPLASLFFISLPPLVMLELMIIFVLVFLCIVPLCNPAGNLWDMISVASDVAIETELTSVFAVFSYAEEWPRRVVVDYDFYQGIIMLCVLVLSVVIVSAFVDRSNRKAFIQKKIIETLTKQREKVLLMQKEDHENLIHSMFPPVVAKDLIRQQTRQTLKQRSFELRCKSFDHRNLRHMSLGRSVAQMHQQVTILFTDIVGFTSMSQTVEPSQVMEFLHELFTAFDELIDMDSSLWKVETIGDAFMVASGLEHTKGESERGSWTGRLTARAAVLFGKSALEAAQMLTMPNGEQCQIRAGVHTGDVCSGVVGTRMPRYCLFGDTVNTASRMESSGVPGRMQISEVTHDLVCDGDEFAWDERGFVEVKGKGKLRTYLLRELKENF